MTLHSPIFRRLLWVVLIPPFLALAVSEFFLFPSIRSAVSLYNADTVLKAMRWVVLSAASIAALLGCMLAYLFSRALILRIHRLREFSEDMGTSRSIKIIPPEPDDELGALARSLDRVSVQLRDIVGRLSEESKSREAILASMVEGVVAVDQNLKVTFYNKSFQKLVGLLAPASESISIVELVRDSQLIQMLKQVVASQEPLNQRLQLPFGESRIFEAYAGPLGGASSKGAIAILHDITELDRLERVRKDFVANVSHELRTPLTAICGYAETLLDGGLEDRENNRRFVEIIETHAKRINDISSDLLILSELQSAKPKAPPDRVPVRDALETVLRTIESEAQERKVRLVCGEIEDSEVFGNRVHLEQAVLNLLQNAVKFNRPGGDVSLNVTRTAEGMICIAIADTGVGIPSEDLARIFERFYRVDKARSREVGGTGLGLSIVKHAIERMNGTVEVESQLGKGSEFKITLPLANGLPADPVA